MTDGPTSSRRFTRRERNRLACLKRRRDYLAGLIDDGEGNGFDVREHSALTWALDQLNSNQEAPHAH